MTTVKEFEEQKQEIVTNLNKAITDMLNNENQIAINIIFDQIIAIQKLQLPKYKEIYTDACVAYMAITRILDESKEKNDR